jgi:hypothetical protein
VLVHGQGFAGDGGLIDLKEGIFGDDSAVGGDDGALFDLENVSGDNLGRLDFLQPAITEDGGLERECLFQLLDNGAGLVFLDEADKGVEQEQGADDPEVDPVLETSGENGSSLRVVSMADIDRGARAWGASAY